MIGINHSNAPLIIARTWDVVNIDVNIYVLASTILSKLDSSLQMKPTLSSSFHFDCHRSFTKFGRIINVIVAAKWKKKKNLCFPCTWQYVQFHFIRRSAKKSQQITQHMLDRSVGVNANHRSYHTSQWSRQTKQKVRNRYQLIHNGHKFADLADIYLCMQNTSTPSKLQRKRNSTIVNHEQLQ